MISVPKLKKININIEFSIFEIVEVPNFIFNNFNFLDQIWQKEGIFDPKKRKSEHHYQIQNIRITLGI